MWLKKLLNKYKDDRFFDEVFKHEIYKEAKEVAKKDIVIDIGATAGEFSFYIYDQAKKIYAIEPYSEHFEELKENVEKYKLKKIKPFRLAIAGSDGDRELFYSGRGRGDASLVWKDKECREIVPTVTLAKFMFDNKISHVDILKIDVESAEHEIFSCPSFKTIADKIEFIIGEVHQNKGRLPKILENNGFSFEEYPGVFVARR